MSEEKKEVSNCMEKRNVATSARDRSDAAIDAGIEKAAGMFYGSCKEASSSDDSEFRAADEAAERG